MGRADRLDLGTWNAQCFECGRKRKASDLVKHWQGYYVCKEHWEPRHPQDFVRNVQDRMTVPWSQPVPEPTFRLFCSVESCQPIVDQAVVECAVVAGEPTTLVNLLGVSGVGLIGTTSLSLGQSITLVGQAGTGQIGTLNPSAAVAAAAVVGTGTLGTVTSMYGPGIVGTAGTGQVGTVSLSITSSVTLTGQAGTGAVGTVRPGVVQTLTGQAGTGQVGTLTPTVFSPYSTDYTTPGTQTISIPTGAAAVTIECYAAGGYGSTDTTFSYGGGGGAYSKRNTYSVGGLTGIWISVPAAPTAGANGADAVARENSGAGTIVCLAKGGLAGDGGVGTGGSQASGTGDVKYSGGNGTIYAGGGAAGTGGTGGNASGSTGGTGNGGLAGNGGAGGASPTVGNNYGGGGGSSTNADGNSKAGAKGAIRLSWT